MSVIREVFPMKSSSEQLVSSAASSPKDGTKGRLSLALPTLWRHGLSLHVHPARCEARMAQLTSSYQSVLCWKPVVHSERKIYGSKIMKARVKCLQLLALQALLLCTIAREQSCPQPNEVLDSTKRWKENVQCNCKLRSKNCTEGEREYLTAAVLQAQWLLL